VNFEPKPINIYRLPMDALYDRLLELVPKSVSTLDSSTSASAEKLRRTVICSSRIVTLFSYVSSLPEDSLVHFGSADRLQNVFHPPDHGSFPGSSQFSQNTAFVVTFLMDNPDVFAESILSQSASPDFDYLVCSCLPSIFCYFCTDETLSQAFQFYSKIAELADPNLCIRIFTPFFNSPPTFRFLEHALDRFFRTFLYNHLVSPAKDYASEVAMHGSFLLDCFVRSISLLPDQHLQLLRIIWNKPWRSDQFANLFLVRFLWPSTLNWLKCSPFADCSRDLERVIVGIGSQKESLRQFYRVLLKAHSTFTLPRMFNGFDLFYVSYYFCVHDIQLLVKVLESQKVLPRGVSVHEFFEIDKSHFFCYYWCLVFPKRTPPAKPRLEHFLFDTEVDVDSLPPSDRQVEHGGKMVSMKDGLHHALKRARTFEAFLEKARQYSMMTQWATLVVSRVNQLSVRVIEYFRTGPQQSLSHELWQWMQFDRIDNDLLTPHMRELGEFADGWNALMKTYNGVDIATLVTHHECAVSRMWESIRMFRCLEKITPKNRFPLMMAGLTHFHLVVDRLGMGLPLFGSILQQLPANLVLVSFVLFNATLARDNDFMSGRERSVWLRFEAAVYYVLRENPVLTRQIVSKIDEIADHFAKKVKA
jgi:hypothetical protein